MSKSHLGIWYAVRAPDRNSNQFSHTVGRRPLKEGWETDSGYEGYGITMAEAEWLARATRIAAAFDYVWGIAAQGETHEYAVLDYIAKTAKIDKQGK